MRSGLITCIMLFSFRQFFLAWVFVRGVGCTCLFFCKYFSKNYRFHLQKNKVVQVCWLTKTMTKKTGCNTAEGLCVLASVCGLKPSPCLCGGAAGLYCTADIYNVAGLYLSSGKSLNISVRLLIIVSGEGKYFL
jgi:hypothetical protein